MNRNVVIKILSAMRPDGGPKPVYTATEKCEALDAAIAALRGSTREHPKGTLSAAVPPRAQVEKVWRGEWIKHDGYTECSECEYWYPSTEDEEEDDRNPFCPACGRPMTDKAVDIIMSRLEALYGE